MTLPKPSPTRARAWLADNPQIPQTIAAFAIKIVGAGLSFGFSLLIARAYGPAGVGAFGLMVTTLTLAATACLVGLDYVLIRTVAGDVRQGALGAARGVVRTITRIVGGNALLMWGLLALLAIPLLTRFAGGPDATAVLAAASFGVLPIALIRVVSSTLRSTGRVLLAQLLDGPLSMALALAALGGFLIAGQPDVRDAGRIYVAAIGVTVLLGAGIAWRDTARWPVAAAVAARPLLAGGVRILAVVLAGFATDWVILTVLARYRSTAEVGLFRTAWQVATLFNIVVVAFDAVAGPRIAAAWRIDDRAAIARTWRQAVAVITGLSLPLLIVVLAAPEWVLHFFGPAFPAAATALRILALGQLVNMLTGPIGSILVMTGHERWSMMYSIAALLVATVFAVTIIPYFGLEGAATVSSGALIFRNLIAFYLVSRFIRLGRRAA